MKNHFVILLLIAASAAPVLAQENLPFPTEPDELLKCDYKLKLRYADSISNYFYPGFFRPGKNCMPEYPQDTQGKYSSYLEKIYDSKGFTGLCGVISIHYKKKDIQGYEGYCNMRIMDLTNNEKGMMVYASKQIRTIKKHTKLKLVTYICCEPPYYDNKDIKKITATIRYEPFFKWRTRIDYTVKHLKYNNNNSKKYRNSFMRYPTSKD